MRTYSTNAAKITTVRRAGFTPTRRQAEILAKRVCFVLSRESLGDIEACRDHLLANVVQEATATCVRWIPPTEAASWSPADVQAVARLLDWFSYDACDPGEEDESNAQKAFVLIDLNVGRSLVIIDRQ